MNQYTHRYSLTAADMDTRYRMTPNAVLLYYQDCWARYMACLHLAAFDIVKQNRIWVITEFNAWFEEQTALWSDDIDVTVWNSEVGALRLYAEFRVRRADGVEVAHGYGCWTLLDTEAHRLAPMMPFQPQIPVLQEVCQQPHVPLYRHAVGGRSFYGRARDPLFGYSLAQRDFLGRHAHLPSERIA